jgi:multicomponent Na+:H+ antiporter subunit F
MNAYLWAAAVLIVSIAPCLLVCLRANQFEGLVALELAGSLTTLALLCLAEGYHRGIYFAVALVCAVLSWAGGMVIARFFSRVP